MIEMYGLLTENLSAQHGLHWMQTFLVLLGSILSFGAMCVFIYLYHYHKQQQRNILKKQKILHYRASEILYHEVMQSDGIAFYEKLLRYAQTFVPTEVIYRAHELWFSLLTEIGCSHAMKKHVYNVIYKQEEQNTAMIQAIKSQLEIPQNKE